MTPPNAPLPTSPSGSTPAPWFEDAREIDRHLDGEGDPGERARREADVAARPGLSARLARRRAFLEALRSGRWAPAGSSVADLRRLEERVRSALHADAGGRSAAPGARSPVRRRSALVAVAAVLAGLGAWFLAGRGTEQSNAWAVSMAVKVLDWQPSAFGTCAQDAHAGDVYGFPLVREGEMQVRGCASEPPRAGASVAQLWRPEELPVVGYVAVPASGEKVRGEIGITEVESGRVVVFDMVDGNRRVYLAVDAVALKVKHASGERWKCAACHGPARQAQDNPHRIVLRKAP